MKIFAATLILPLIAAFTLGTVTISQATPTENGATVSATDPVWSSPNHEDEMTWDDPTWENDDEEDLYGDEARDYDENPPANLEYDPDGRQDDDDVINDRDLDDPFSDNDELEQ